MTQRKSHFLHLGILLGKAFFYTLNDAGLVFSSELRPLLEHPDISNKLENNSIAHYLIYSLFRIQQRPYKIFISQLALNLYILLTSIKLKSKNIGRISRQISVERSAKLSDKKLISLTSSILEKSVVRHLRSDVPLGIYLSGGIDSNVLLDVSSKHINPSSIQTFTVGSDDKSFDESSISCKTSMNLVPTIMNIPNF